MFLAGKHVVQMDARGRISFPTCFQKKLGDILTVSPDNNQRGYLVVRTTEDYNAYCEQMVDALYAAMEDDPDMEEEDIEDAIRDYCGSSEDIGVDKNGRITLPEHLRTYAGLSANGKVMVVGVRNGVELWDADTFEEVQRRRHDEKRTEKDVKRALKAKHRAVKTQRMQEEVDAADGQNDR